MSLFSPSPTKPELVDGKYVYPRPEFPAPLKVGSLLLKSRYALSPLAKYTNLPFRLVVRSCGGLGLATCDLVNARALLAQSAKSLALVRTCPEDTPFAAQIFGGEAEFLRDAAQFLESRGGVEVIDINMGCPVEHVTRSGAGASLMCNLSQSARLVQSVVEAVSLPVTVKMRLGWDETQLTAPRFAKEFEQIGVKAIAIHGRTRSQGFKGSVDLGGFGELLKLSKKFR